MQKAVKIKIIEKAKEHVVRIRRKISEESGYVKKLAQKSEVDFKSNPLSDRGAYENFRRQSKKRLAELDELEGSPYFVRCQVKYENQRNKKELFFSKFQFAKEKIYSWIAPAALIRFEKPGHFSFRKPSGAIQKGVLLKKDQYMIVGGKIIFLATESRGCARQLVYQEYFSNLKRGFILPEIVAQMEKAQDKVIRASHQGPFLISGPAGSGKTTLALHRVAFLVQSPDSSHLYPSESIVVFVQDEGTQDYFSHLLPQLGIQNVKIVTFDRWAMDILEIKNAKYVVGFGETQEEKIFYEREKLAALNNLGVSFSEASKDYFFVLEKAFQNNFSKRSWQLFRKQKEKRVLDRFDLTLLLKNHKDRLGSIGKVQFYYEETSNGRFRKVKKWMPLKYSMAVIDEFQNHLPLQLKLIKSCIKENRSILYVGELAQQIQLGTVRDWNEIEEIIENGRSVILRKIYRNTEEILNYIRSVGYKIDIPRGVRNGNAVMEINCQSPEEELKYIRQCLEAIGSEDFADIGIIAKEKSYLAKFNKAFKSRKHLHLMSIREVQGIEFDKVFLVGLDKNDFPKNWEGCNYQSKMDSELLQIKKKSSLHCLDSRH